MALLNTLDQATAFAGVQLGHEPDGLIVSTAQVLLYLVQGVVDIDPPQLVVPAVFG